MAVSSVTTSPSLSSLNTQERQAGEPQLGLRGSISLGSGLRAGVVLLEGADRSTAELQTARDAAAEAAREATRGDAERRAVEDSGRAEPRSGLEATGAQDGSGRAETEPGAIAAAVQAGQQGVAAERGSFVDLGV